MVLRVRVWDLPTRVFHWSLAACFVGLVVTSEVGNDAMAWHFRFGYAVLALVMFRLVWGFIGGHWSRFTSFVRGPSRIFGYLRGQPTPIDDVGHNPLGALSVLGLLALCLAQATTGLFSDDEIAVSGPLVNLVAQKWVSMATFLHTEVFKIALFGLVGLHLAVIVLYRWRYDRNLIPAMLHGDKDLSPLVESAKDTTKTRLLALVVFTMCAAVVAALLWWANQSEVIRG